MKTRIAVVLVCFNVFFLSAKSLAQSQSDLNSEAQADFAAADKQLTQVCERIRGKLDSAGKQKLAAAQKAWVAYREAQAGLEADQIRGGTAASSILNATRAELTRQQIERLQKILPTD